MLKHLNGNQKNFIKKLKTILEKRKVKDSDNSILVKKIIRDIKKNKDNSLIKFEKKFSKIKNLNKSKIKFKKKEIESIIKKLDTRTKKSIDLAFQRIYNFHKKQKYQSFKIKDKYIQIIKLN